MTRYGQEPLDIGAVDLSPEEMMCWLYLPVSLPGQWVCQLPPNLRQFSVITDMVKDEIGESLWDKSYVYITAKTLHVNSTDLGNRPGWHSDGFMTDDLNFIWYDREPTLFWIADEPVLLPADHAESLIEMERFASNGGNVRTYPCKHLLKLDQSVIHRVADIVEPGIRTFVKVSVSQHLYAQIGNSINHALDYPRPSFVRSKDRNCPAARAVLAKHVGEA